MTVHEYQQALSTHDWYYIFSDDPRIYDRGKANEQKLIGEALGNEELMSLYKKELSTHFKHTE